MYDYKMSCLAGNLVYLLENFGARLFGALIATVGFLTNVSSFVLN